MGSNGIWWDFWWFFHGIFMGFLMGYDGDLSKRTWDLRKGGPTKHGDLNHHNFINNFHLSNTTGFTKNMVSRRWRPADYGVVWLVWLDRRWLKIKGTPFWSQEAEDLPLATPKSIGSSSTSPLKFWEYGIAHFQHFISPIHTQLLLLKSPYIGEQIIFRSTAIYNIELVIYPIISHPIFQTPQKNNQNPIYSRLLVTNVFYRYITDRFCWLKHHFSSVFHLHFGFKSSVPAA